MIAIGLLFAAFVVVMVFVPSTIAPAFIRAVEPRRENEK